MVYIDNFQAPFGKMKMCHMIADSTKELFAMVDAIGVQRKWIQDTGLYTEHFDICMSKRALAIANGAIAIPMMELGKMVAKRNNNSLSMQYAYIHEIPPGRTFSSGNALRYKVLQQMKYNTLVKEVESGVEKNIPAPMPPGLLVMDLLTLHNGFKVLMDIKAKR